jgi:hypothetical protein
MPIGFDEDRERLAIAALQAKSNPVTPSGVVDKQALNDLAHSARQLLDRCRDKNGVLVGVSK